MNQHRERINLVPELSDGRFGILPQFAHLASEPGSVFDTTQFAPEVLDHHTTGGVTRIREISQMCPDPLRDISIEPFAVGYREITDLATHLVGALRGVDLHGSVAVQAVRESVTQQISVNIKGVELDKVRELLDSHFLIPDLTDLTKNLGPYTEFEAVEAESRWIWDPYSHRLTKYIGVGAHRLLSISRLLGLIPFQDIYRLRETRFRVLGASVAASTIDLLAALGAEDITFVDGGLLSPSGQGKMVGDLANFQNNGLPKASVLERQLKRRNPYGRFLGLPGKVLQRGEEKGPYDITIDELIKDADEVIEVVDNPGTKVAVRFDLAESAPLLPIGFIADLGSRPFAGREIPADGNPFHQGLSAEQLRRMKDLLSIKDLVKYRQEGVRAVYLMISRDLPPEHKLQFLLSCLGIVPYWSQTPISTRESAAIYAKIFLSNISGINVTPDRAPTSLGVPIKPPHTTTLDEILTKLLDI